MKKLSLILALVFVSLSVAWTQRTIKGTITDEAGKSLVGASVFVKGTNIGTGTDLYGKFTIYVPQGSQYLKVTYKGFSTAQIKLGRSNAIDIKMLQGTKLKEEALTALDIKREKRPLAYALQELHGEDLSFTPETNVVSALSGEIAGVQVVTASAASLGGTANIRIRGANGLYGGSPLFVVDGTPISNRIFDDNSHADAHRGVDYGNLVQDINPDDIATISVLKGPTAAALYGHRAANGVVMMRTKKGKKDGTISVDWTSSIMANQVAILPEFQNEYAGGHKQEWSTFEYDPAIHDEKYASSDGHNILKYAADESWGPKIDGTLYRPWWSWNPNNPEFGQRIPLTAQPDNIKNFYNIGLNYTNQLALAGGNDHTNFRLSYRNLKQTGVIPNSRLSRNNVSLNAITHLTDRLTLSTGIHVAVTTGHARPTYGYLKNNSTLSLNQWFQRQLDIDELRTYQNPDGSLRTWNIRSPTDLQSSYWNSPFYGLYENVATDKRDRYFGNMTLHYDITDHLSVQASARRDSYNQRIERRTASGSLDLDEYAELFENAYENNYDFLLQYHKRFRKLRFNVNLGGNHRQNHRHYNYIQTEGGLAAPNLFNVNASTDTPTMEGGTFNKAVKSLYGTAHLSYKSRWHLEGTFRRDWFSALPSDNNAYVYPSVTGSFIFPKWMKIAGISFGKLRASFAKVGTDVEPYQTGRIYENGASYGSMPGFNMANVLNNEQLQPGLTTAYEGGLELRFLKNRLTFDLTFYKQNAQNQLLWIDVPGASGFEKAMVNTGYVRNQGFELVVAARPVQILTFNWDMVFNIGKNKSTIIELADGLDNVRLDEWGWGDFSLNAPVEGEWGTMIGTGYKIHEATGLPIIREDGTYVEEHNKNLGSSLPNFTGGFRNAFSFMGFSLGMFIEFQGGGQFHSITKMYNAYSGLAAETAGLNDKGNPVRDPVAEGGGLLVEGVLEDGTPHSVYTDIKDLYKGNLFAFHERWIYDASYVKLRELSIGYSIPKKLLNPLPFKSLSFALFGKNIWMMHSNVDGIDPSQITPGTNGFVFQENGILPSLRSFGFQLNVGF